MSLRYEEQICPDEVWKALGKFIENVEFQMLMSAFKKWF